MGITRRRGGASQVNKNPPQSRTIQLKYMTSLRKPTKLKGDKVSNIVYDGIPLVNLIGHLTDAYKDSILLKCQPVGGFEVDYEEINVGKNGNPSKIYERMGKIATENFIAVTELGEIKGEYSEERVMMDGLNKKIEKNTYSILGKVGNKFDDNAFIIKNEGNTNNELLFNNETNTLNKTNTELAGSSFSNLKFISANGINILNVHLPSDGPKLNSIFDFLKAFLPSQEELHQKIPDLIVGDTNITCLKCNKILKPKEGTNNKAPAADTYKIYDTDPKTDEGIEDRLTNRNAIMQEMISAISSIYKKEGSTWALLMSTTRVNKRRNGGILTNQQANKKMVGSNEPDGTAIFIKVTGTLDDEFLNNSSNFGHNWILCYDGKFYPNPQPKVQTKDDAVNFLHFDTDVDNCLDETSGFLKDTLFIDHTPVQISFNAIQKMNPTLTSTPAWKNVVVLNAGAITCSSSNKNWKLNLIPCMDKIKKIDETLFNGMKTILAPTSTKGYLDTPGNEYAKWNIIENNVPIIAELLAKTEIDLSTLDCFSKKANALQKVSKQRPAPRKTGETNQASATRLRMSLTNYIKKFKSNMGTSIGGKHTKKTNRKSKRR